jgi:hypothetical protein
VVCVRLLHMLHIFMGHFHRIEYGTTIGIQIFAQRYCVRELSTWRYWSLAQRKELGFRTSELCME